MTVRRVTPGWGLSSAGSSFAEQALAFGSGTPVTDVCLGFHTPGFKVSFLKNVAIQFKKFRDRGVRRNFLRYLPSSYAGERSRPKAVLDLPQLG